MAKELPRIQGQCSCSGFILPPPGFEQERWDQLVQKLPAGRSGSAENDVVEAVQFLVQNTFIPVKPWSWMADTGLSKVE